MLNDCRASSTLRSVAEVRACAQFTGIIVGLVVGMVLAGVTVSTMNGTSLWVDAIACMIIVALAVVACRAMSVKYAENRSALDKQAAASGMDAPGDMFDPAEGDTATPQVAKSRFLWGAKRSERRRGTDSMNE